MTEVPVQRVLELARLLQGRSLDGEVDRLLRRFLSEQVFPLVQDDTATFVFYDGDEADEVRLLHWVFGLESSLPFTRMGNTRAWYLSLELPSRGRIEYKLLVKRGGRDILMRDPHNPRRALDPFGSNSVCPMPGYQEPAWAEREPGVRRGNLERFTLASKVWGDERGVDVYLPGEFSPQKKYPLLIVHDGDDYRQFANFRGVLDNLIHRHEVRPLVVAFVSGKNRNWEYAANPQQAAFIVDEVLPALCERYPISPDPEDRGLCGASFGGVTSLYTAWSRPGTFKRLLLQSGSFVFTDIGGHGRPALWDPIVQFVNTLRTDPARVDARIYMSCGTFESLIYYNRSLAPLLRQAGREVRFVEAQDGHNWIAWRDRLREGLTYLFPGYLWMTYE